MRKLKILHNRGGFSSMVVILFFSVAFIGFASLVNLGNSYARIQKISVESVQAFYLAESALQDAQAKLRDDFSTFPVTGDGTPVPFGNGEYMYEVTNTANPDEKLITATGAIPSIAAPTSTRTLEMTIESTPETLPAIFDHALYAFDDIDLNGASNNVNGDVFSGDDVVCSPSSCPGVSGTITENDDENYPLTNMQLATLKAMSQAQGNYYSSSPSANSLPTSFWYATGVPNIVFIEGDLTISGNRTVAGFYVVVGSYLTTGNLDGDVTLNGRITVNGVIFTTGDFTENGGGQVSNVDGGVITFDDINLNGTFQVDYNATYMDAVDDLELTGLYNVQSLYWTETT